MVNIGNSHIAQSFCQLPKVYSPELLQENEWIGISRKANGVHAVFLNGELYTREHTLIVGCAQIIDECWMLNEALGGTTSMPFVIEGELLLDGSEFMDEFDRFSKTAAAINKKNIEEKTFLTLNLFDAVRYSDYCNPSVKAEELYIDRKHRLVNAYNYIADDVEKLKLVDFLYEGTDHSKIEEWFKYSKEAGWEGIVINRNTPYLRSKNCNALKYKHNHTMDLKIVDFKPGMGRFKGTLGALIVDFNGNNVAVGTGFDIKTRDYIWTHRPELLGRIAEIQYQCVTHTGKRKDNLQFPVYICIRPEGKEVNYDD